MDQRRNSQLIVSTFLLVLLFTGQALGQLPPTPGSNFKTCFGICFATTCFYTNYIALCASGCVAKCLSTGGGSYSLNSCKYGCTVNKCADRLTNDFQIEDVDKVDDCVNQCETGKCSVYTKA